MVDMLNKAYSQELDYQDGLSLVEVCGPVAALAVFVSIYTYIVPGAFRSTPW